MKKLLLICCVFCIISCTKKYTIERSFCYWKTSNYSNNIEKQTADSLGVNHIYMRMFDVGWNPYDKQPKPIATLWDLSDDNNRLNITPSVYITNDVLLQSSRQQLQELAKNIKNRITRIIETSGEKTVRYTVYKYGLDGNEQAACEKEEQQIFNDRFTEVLIDCDWTVKSQGNYFYLLREIKKQLPHYKLATTIRLWQYRDYKQAGVPPSDRGLLMCYNMSDPAKHQNENSIGSSKIMAQYINHDNYPLKLDAALPIFNWALVFRGNKFKGILPEGYYNIDDIDFKKIADNRFIIKHDMVISETYYRKGDEIRVEKVSDGEMKKMITLLKNNIDLEGSRVTFFSWNESYINNYGIKTITGYYSLFGE